MLSGILLVAPVGPVPGPCHPMYCHSDTGHHANSPPSHHGASVSLTHSTDNAREGNHHLPGTSRTFKIQFLLELFVQLLTVELGVCTLEIKVAFELDGILLNVSGAALPPGAIPGASVP